MNENSRKEVLGVSTITHKYQITIPKKVRERQGLKEGDTLVFVEENGKVFLKSSVEV